MPPSVLPPLIYICPSPSLPSARSPLSPFSYFPHPYFYFSFSFSSSILSSSSSVCLSLCLSLCLSISQMSFPVVLCISVYLSLSPSVSCLPSASSARQQVPTASRRD